MKKFLLIIVALVVNLNSSLAQEYSKAYFAGGCFWCVEEYFDDQLGVISTISGYSGGRTKRSNLQTGYIRRHWSCRNC